MVKKFGLILSMITVTTTLITACGSTASNSTKQEKSSSSPDSASKGDKKPEGKMTIKLAHVANDQSGIQVGALKFKELVEKNSNGQMEVTVFPGGQLGNEKDLVESTKMGTVNITIPSSAMLSNFVPKATVLTLPYIIKGTNERERYASFQKLSKSEPYKEMAAESEKAGLVLIPEAVWWIGDRHVTTKDKEIKKPEDLKGLKIRTPDAQAHTEPFKQIGANVTPMGISEVYMALKTGTLEAQENSVDMIYVNKFYEVQNTVNLTGHMSQNELPVMNLNWWKSLTAEQQKVITNAMIEAGTYSSEYQLKANEDELKELQAKGMKVVQSDQAAFKEATQNVFKAFEGKVGTDYYQKIIKAQE